MNYPGKEQGFGPAFYGNANAPHPMKEKVPTHRFPLVAVILACVHNALPVRILEAEFPTFPHIPIS